MRNEELILELVAIRRDTRDLLVIAELNELIRKLEKEISNETV